MSDVSEKTRFDFQDQQARSVLKEAVLMRLPGSVKNRTTGDAFPTASPELFQVASPKRDGYIRVVMRMEQENLIGSVGDGDQAEIGDASRLCLDLRPIWGVR